MNNNRGSYNQSYLYYTIDQMVYEFMDENQISGLQMAIVQAPYIPRVVGYGLADVSLGAEKLVGINTIFSIGRISQAFLSVALFQAHEQKLLNYKDKVTKWIPELGSHYDDITLYDLMQNTSGVYDFRKIEGYDPKKLYPKEEIIKWLSKHKLNFIPKTAIDLNPSNAYLLATAIEKASKTSYVNFVKQNQIDFLELKNTFFESELNKITEDKLSKSQPLHEKFKHEKTFINGHEIAIAHLDNDPRKLDDSFDKNLKGFADIFANAQDISTWDIALAGTILIKEKEHSQLIYNPIKIGKEKINASGGWQFNLTPGFMDIFGSNGGYSSYLSRFTDPNDLICVTLLANKKNIDFTELGRKIAAAYKTQLATGLDYHDLYQVESSLSPSQTYEKLKTVLNQKSLQIFAEIDHQKNADSSKLKMNFNKLIIFGNAKIGTSLMQEIAAFGLELPLKIQVFEDDKKRVWVSAPNLLTLSDEYAIEDQQKIEMMWKNIKNIINESIRVY